jgi:hypothetical protein
MTDRPIIFSAPMVRALLDGRKTQTRRIIKHNRRMPNYFGPKGDERDPSNWGWETDWPESILLAKERPTDRDIAYLDLATTYQPGDRLWVRENHALVGGGDPGIPIYAANWREDARARGFDNIPEKAPRWTPSIHMPRWASRLTLIVEAVKVERLNDISEADAQAEGVEPIMEAPGVPRADKHIIAFMQLWERLHGDGAWRSNPWVVAVTFRVLRDNIDAVAA